MSQAFAGDIVRCGCNEGRSVVRKDGRRLSFTGILILSTLGGLTMEPNRSVSSSSS